jgi:hypothetical protein
MKNILGIILLSLLWCNIGITGERKPGTDQKCFDIFEREKIFEKKFLPKNKESHWGGVLVTYVGCNEYYDDWSWDYSTLQDIDAAHETAYYNCKNEMRKYKLTGCHLFSIGDVIVWGKNAAFVKKVEKKLFVGMDDKTKSRVIAENKSRKAQEELLKGFPGSYVYHYIPFIGRDIFTKSSPTTFKKLSFNKEKKISNIIKRTSHNAGWKNKKIFRSFSFTAEYEDNITVNFLVEYEKDKKDFKKAEEKVLFYSKMYGQMPHFLKEHNKIIYIHNDVENNQGYGTWWVMYDKRAFHINPSKSYNNCISLTKYSTCAITMVHELAHVIQQNTKVISPSKWVKAKTLDNKRYCSKYSKKNGKEDFAESMVCWVGVRLKSDKIKKNNLKKIKLHIPNRLQLFDKMNFNIYPL